MEKIIDFVKANLPLIAAVFAFTVAAIIILAVVIAGVKKRKRAASIVEENLSENSAIGESVEEKPEETPEQSGNEETEQPAENEVLAEEKPQKVSVAEKIAATSFTVKSAPKAQTAKPSKPEEFPAEGNLQDEETNEIVENTEEENMAKIKETTATAAKTTPASKTASVTKKTAAKPVAQAKKPEAAAKKSAPAAKPAAAKKAEVKTTETEVKKITGKWVIKEKGEGEFVAFLYANNGELILTSEIYASEESARTGIETIKKNIGGDVQIYKDKNRNYYFKLKSVKNRILCVGETYKTRDLCENAADSVKRFADSPVQDGVEKDITVIKYVLPKKEPKLDERSAYSGKWVIEKDDDTYMAKLFASNGELLLNSESYVSYASAKSAIETIKTNGIAGNFIIDSDKKGRYFFKLRSAQKATLCIGETYAQLSACQSAIESVRRFLKTAKLNEG